MIDVRVISQQPPGGRCTLYTCYGQILAQHLGSSFHLDISAVRDTHGHGFPSIWINGIPLKPSDGIIVMPDDILAILNAGNIAASDELYAALDAEAEKLLNPGE